MGREESMDQGITEGYVAPHDTRPDEELETTEEELESMRRELSVQEAEDKKRLALVRKEIKINPSAPPNVRLIEPILRPSDAEVRIAPDTKIETTSSEDEIDFKSGTLYENLGFKPGDRPSSEEIRTHYRRLAREYHPDVNSTPIAASIFNQINTAYNTLVKPDSRNIYDSSLQKESANTKTQDQAPVKSSFRKGTEIYTTNPRILYPTYHRSAPEIDQDDLNDPACEAALVNGPRKFKEFLANYQTKHGSPYPLEKVRTSQRAINIIVENIRHMIKVRRNEDSEPLGGYIKEWSNANIGIRPVLDDERIIVELKRSIQSRLKARPNDPAHVARYLSAWKQETGMDITDLLNQGSIWNDIQKTFYESGKTKDPELKSKWEAFGWSDKM